MESRVREGERSFRERNLNHCIMAKRRRSKVNYTSAMRTCLALLIFCVLTLNKMIQLAYLLVMVKQQISLFPTRFAQTDDTCMLLSNFMLNHPYLEQSMVKMAEKWEILEFVFILQNMIRTPPHLNRTTKNHDQVKIIQPRNLIRNLL